MRLICRVLAALAVALFAMPASAPARVHVPLGVGAWQWYLGSGDFQRLHQAGVSLYRTPIRWELVERSPGNFDFARYDEVFAAAARNGIRVTPVLFGDPGTRSPYDLAGFARYARAVASRYGERGAFWRGHRRLPYLPARSFEVWNEENDPGFWAGPPDPAGYVRLLRTARGVLRNAAPHARVVFGGTACTGVDQQRFLAAVLARGGRPLFDDYSPTATSPATRPRTTSAC